MKQTNIAARRGVLRHGLLEPIAIHYYAEELGCDVLLSGPRADESHK